MSRCNSSIGSKLLFLIASVVLFSSHGLLINRVHQLPPSPLPFRLHSTISPESNFWIAIGQNKTSNSDDKMPAIPHLDRETGRLPPGAYYQSVDSDDGGNTAVTAPCLIAVGIIPPSTTNDGKSLWMEGVKNSQQLIDSGFNTFRVNNFNAETGDDRSRRKKRRRRDPSSIAFETIRNHMMQIETRHQAETNFYHTLQQNTPSSVLRTCHFMVNLEIPSILSDESILPGMDKDASPVPFGDGWMVRESVSDALMRTKGESLDSVVLEYKTNSPYHLDVLDSLCEMKREGIIKSISTKDFPPSLLESAFDCGFDIQSNDIGGNLMRTNNLRPESELGVLCKDRLSRIISTPLAGGLFTNQFCQYQEWEQLSASSKKKFNALIDSCCDINGGARMDKLKRWQTYRTTMDTLVELSLKYQASVESIALRWLLQLNNGNSVYVGTHMGMDLVEEQGGAPYSRHRDLRQVFTFSLDKDDMERLSKISGLTAEKDTDHEIDFNNRALWM